MIENMKTKVWITKYALSSGITENDADIREGRAYPGAPFVSYVSFKIGTDAFLSREEAVQAAHLARKKKVASLKKQITALEALKFD